MSRANQAKKGQKEELVHRLWGRTEKGQYGPKVREGVALKIREEVTPKVREGAAPKVREGVALKIREEVTPKVRQRVALKIREGVAPEVRESPTSTTGPEGLFPIPRWVHWVLFPPQ